MSESMRLLATAPLPEDARRVAFAVLRGYNVAGPGVARLGAGICQSNPLFAMRPRS
jgi:hypothetical protein